MSDSLLKYSSSPHIKAPHSTKWIMINVCIALLPATIMGIIYFGLYALLLVSLSIITSVASEIIYLLIMGKKFNEIIKQFDFTSCVTGLLIGMSIGTNYPWYAPVLGSVFAIIVVKMLFGGTGKNIVNPAVTGRIFVFISFQAVVGIWLKPSINAIFGSSEISTGATVLSSMLETGTTSSISLLDMFFGTGICGCIGETCKVALIIGGIYLSIRGIIKIIYPVIYITITGLFAVALNGFNFTYFLPTILSGGLMLGAIFMATDYTTSPNTFWGNFIYYFALGLLTAGLRQATKMEVVSFAILLMNLFVPLIDKFILPKPFGCVKSKKGVK